jgi:hypothetical protein
MSIGTVAADPTPGVRIQIPRIDIGDVLGTGDWETWIQVQNVSHDVDTGAIFFGWGEYSELCPSNAPGPIVHYCQLIRGNALWTLKNQLPDYVVRNGITHTIQSGIIYSVRADVFGEACDAAGWAEGSTHRWLEWEKEWENGNGTIRDLVTGLLLPYSNFGNEDPADPTSPEVGAQGEDLAVTVTRYGPNDYGTFVSSTYTGISEEMEGVDAPYEYYAPYVMKGYNGLDTELTIQNSGQLCTSVWIDYMEQGSCRILYKYHIELLAPGESIRVKVPCNVGQIPCFWLGSAHISAEQPLGIVVDETSFAEPCGTVDRGTLLTHRARPKKELRGGEPIEDTFVYADLIFREWSGWDASIQVQNLSRTGQNTFVTVDFLDNSGDEILFLADWVCPMGSATFYLPIVTNLGYDYVGAAEIQSHDQVAFPGETTPAQPIFAVVDLKKPDNPLTPEMDAQGGSYNAHPASQKEWVTEIALPFTAKEARDIYTPWTSLIAIRNNSNCNKIKPKIWFRDETGRLLCELNSFWLQPKHVKMIDLNNIGCLYSGYIGAAKVIIDDVEQLCDINEDGVVDQEPVMPSVIMVQKGILGLSGGGGVTALADTWGDVTSIYEGIPYRYEYWPCDITISGHVVDQLTLEPIEGASIQIDGVEYDTTDSTGFYSFEYTKTNDPEGEDITLVALHDDYSDVEGDYQVTLEDVVCDDQVANFELYPECDTVWVFGYVEDKMTGKYINGATVMAANCVDDDTDVTHFGGPWWVNPQYYHDGYYELELDFDPDCTTWVWASAKDYNSSYDSVFIPICDTAAMDFQLRQTPKAKVLLYYGNGGVGDPTLGSTDPISYTHLAAYFENLGKTVVYTDVWPTQFDWTTKYELIVLLGPGHDTFSVTAPYTESLAVNGFTWGQKAELDSFLQQDGKLVILSDATSFTGQDVENDLLNDLPVDLSFDQRDLQDGHGDQIVEPNTAAWPKCLTNQVQVYSTADSALPDNWTDVTANASSVPGNLILQNHSATYGADQPMYAADIPSHGNGWVIILGDMHGLSDGAWMSDWNWSADNEDVARNWLLCDP